MISTIHAARIQAVGTDFEACGRGGGRVEILVRSKMAGRAGGRAILMVGSMMAGAASGQVAIEQEPINYLSAVARDPIARLQVRIGRGELELKFDEKQGYWKSVLEALDISPTSQTLVFSKTSLQHARISPRTPRPTRPVATDRVTYPTISEGRGRRSRRRQGTRAADRPRPTRIAEPGSGTMLASLGVRAEREARVSLDAPRLVFPCCLLMRSS